MVLLILAVLWAGVLFSWLRNRSETRSVNSISSFSKHLSVLERTSPFGEPTIQPARTTRNLLDAPATPTQFGPINRRRVVHMSLGEARRRRRDLLVGLGAAATVTFLLALGIGGAMWVLNLLVDAALAAYVLLLARAQRIGAERRAKVRYLPTVTRTPVAEHRSSGMLRSAR